MIFNLQGAQSSSSGSLTQGTIAPPDVMKDKVGYKTDSNKVIGTAPFEYIATDDNGVDEYKLFNDPFLDGKIVLDPNGVQKILRVGDAQFDGVWVAGNKVPFNGQWASSCYGNGKFVVTGNSDKALISEDGLTWTTSDVMVTVSL